MARPEEFASSVFAVVRDGLDLGDRRELPRRRCAAVALYGCVLVAQEVAFLLNTQREHEVDPPRVEDAWA